MSFVCVSCVCTPSSDSCRQTSCRAVCLSLCRFSASLGDYIRTTILRFATHKLLGGHSDIHGDGGADGTSATPLDRSLACLAVRFPLEFDFSDRNARSLVAQADRASYATLRELVAALLVTQALDALTRGKESRRWVYVCDFSESLLGGSASTDTTFPSVKFSRAEHRPLAKTFDGCFVP